jgi:hypothetical protein
MELNISSWDSYLVELAKELGINKIYTIDEELVTKIKCIKVENPIPESIMKKYHQFMLEKVKE